MYTDECFYDIINNYAKYKKIYPIIIAWLAVVVWMVLIFCFSQQTGDDSSATSSKIVAFVLSFIDTCMPFISVKKSAIIFFVRKAAHFTVYAVLAALSAHALRWSFAHIKSIWKIGFAALLLCALYAISDEIHQLFISGRSGQFRDVLIDSAGAICGVVLYFVIYTFTKRYKNSTEKTHSS